MPGFVMCSSERCRLPVILALLVCSAASVGLVLWSQSMKASYEVVLVGTAVGTALCLQLRSPGTEMMFYSSLASGLG